MFDDYDTTNPFINYFQTFDIRSVDNLTEIQKLIIQEITKDTTYNCQETVEKDISRLIQSGISGLQIIDPRHVACLSLRYCHYHELGVEPRWYLLRFWRR